MPRFFVEAVDGDRSVITGEDARHIARSLRCKIGEELAVCDGIGNDYRCSIADIGDSAVVLEVQECLPSVAEPPIPITLYQAMPKGDKLELIVQKAVELGVHRIVTVITERCVSRPDDKSMAKKLERLSRISLEAAKQSGRGIVPAVEGLLTLDEAIAEMQEQDTAVLFYERATEPLGSVLARQSSSIAILVGSEGGFSPEEAERCSKAGLVVCTMGPRILRCETAPMYALSAITYHLENSR